MPVDSLVVNELRTQFKLGATPSALIRRIAAHHADEARLDLLVRDYFREAFHVPMLRLGHDQVMQVAEGGSLAILNESVLHQMIQTRPKWDVSLEGDTPLHSSWLDTIAPTSDTSREVAVDPMRIPELANSWHCLDDEARQYIVRIIVSSHATHVKVHALSALAETLQEQVQLVRL